MQPKISKSLEGIIARTVFETTRSATTRALEDHLLVEILHEEGSLAYQLLSAQLKPWELHQVRERIEREALVAQGPAQQPEEFFRRYTARLQEQFASARRISTGHVLLDVAGTPIPPQLVYWPCTAFNPKRFKKN